MCGATRQLAWWRLARAQDRTSVLGVDVWQVQRSLMSAHPYSGVLPAVGRSATLYGVLIAIAAAVGGLLFGYDTAVISGAILFVREQFQLTPFQTELAVSSVLGGCALGAGVAGYCADRFGRKPVLLV